MKKLLLIATAIVLGLQVSTAQTGSDTVKIYGSSTSGTFKVAPPTQLRSTGNVFQITYEGDGWGLIEQQAFQYAVSLWESALWRVEGIKITARFEELNANELSRLSTITTVNGDTFERMTSLTGSVNAGAKYPLSLVKRMNPEVGNENTNQDMIISFSNNMGLWYFPTDRNTPSNKYDFVMAAMRALAKGFGFYTGVSGNNPARITYKSGSGMPNIYDTKVRNSNTYLLDIVPTNYTNIANFVQRQNTYADKNVYFEYTDYSTSNPPLLYLYAPSVFENQVSIGYFDENAYTNNESALMAPKQRKGDAVHKIGDNVLRVLADIGWYNPNGDVTVGEYTHPLIYIASSINEGAPISLNTNNVFTINPSPHTVSSAQWKFQVLQNDGLFITIDSTASYASSYTLNLGISSIPNQKNCARNETGMIKARILASGTYYHPEMISVSYIVDYDILIPAKPATPQIQVRSIIDYPETWESDVVIEFSALLIKYR